MGAAREGRYAKNVSICPTQACTTPIHHNLCPNLFRDKFQCTGVV
jgi:hypothetical protein